MDKNGFLSYLSLFVHWHIHSDEFFVGLSLWTFFAKSQRRVDRAEHVKHFSVMDLAAEKRNARVFKNTEKVSFNIASKASYVYI